MKLKFKDNFQEYASIKNEFEISDFEDFNVITGINGSGKTHFLKAIENEEIEAEIDNEKINLEYIIFFDHESFKLKNEQNVNSQFVEQERIKFFNELNKINILNSPIFRGSLYTQFELL